MTRFDRFIKQFPDVKIKFKNESYFMNILGFLLFFNKEFMDRYITTIGNTVYFPNPEYLNLNPTESMLITCHEYQHIRDNKLLNKLYPLAYLSPQIFSLFILSVFFIGWWALLFLLFLLPLPSYGRMWVERRGYIMTLFATNEIYKEFGLSSQERMKKLKKEAVSISDDQFCGPGYYFMWPFGIKKDLYLAVNKIISGDILNDDPIYGEIQNKISKSL